MNALRLTSSVRGINISAFVPCWLPYLGCLCLAMDRSKVIRRSMGWSSAELIGTNLRIEIWWNVMNARFFPCYAADTYSLKPGTFYCMISTLLRVTLMRMSSLIQIAREMNGGWWYITTAMPKCAVISGLQPLIQSRPARGMSAALFVRV